MKLRIPVFLVLVVLLVSSLVLPAAAQGPGPDTTAPPREGKHSDPAAAMWQDEQGLWLSRNAPEGAAAAAAPEASGGPDDFGYTWTDVPLDWIDASVGANTGISRNQSEAGPFDIGFPFKFYENTRSQLWVSRYGFLAFNNNSLWDSQSPIPNAGPPNDVIAPLWVPAYNVDGYVRYLRGGTAPNRWFVLEWNRLRDGYGNIYTFQAVLYENGDIRFQYRALEYDGSWSCVSAGIEDSVGLDGLPVIPWCNWPFDHANTALLIKRPPASARANLFPKAQGLFAAPAASATFTETVRNTGELGVDTVDLYLESTWRATLYHADGFTELTDTDGDGQVDTGAIDQGASKAIVIKVDVPGDATVGANDTASVTAISSRNPTKQKSARFQVAVPAAFAASYSQSDQTTLGYYRPGKQVTRRTNAGGSYGYSPAAATMPDGRIVQVWSQGRNLPNNGPWVNELYYALTDNKGNFLRSAAKITDLSGAGGSAYDSSPAVAVSPDGRIGIAFYRNIYRNGYQESNYNIYFLALSSAGDLVVQPTNITNNDHWNSQGSSVRVEHYHPTIAATLDNRFGIVWTRYTSDGSNYASTTWYAVRRADVSAVRGPTQFSGNTRSWGPNVTTLADGSLFITQRSDDSLAYGRINNAGEVVTPLTSYSGANYISAPDAIQLPNGNIVIAFTNNTVGYVVLNSQLQVVKPAMPLTKMSATSDSDVSVTRSGNRAVLTWGDGCCYMPNLYYALLDEIGSVVTPPMIFFSDYANYYLRLPYNGQGNTPLIGDIMPKSWASSPQFAVGAIPVRWSLTDGDAAGARFDVWVRHGVSGAWTKWLSATTATSAEYTGASVGETIYFRTVATDANGNTETDVPQNGDTSTTVAAKEITGRVVNLRGEPVMGALVTASPAAIHAAPSNAQGIYHVYFAEDQGVLTLTAGKTGFDELTMNNVNLASTTGPIDFVLPPAQNAITNGDFETGNTQGWTLSATITPTLLAVRPEAAHTGNYGLRFGFSAQGSDGTSNTQSASQQVVVPAGLRRPTLSFFYRTLRARTVDKLTVSVIGSSATESLTLSMDNRNWTHSWLELDQFRGETVTVTVVASGASADWEVHVDEISLGDAIPGSHRTLMPALRR